MTKTSEYSSYKEARKRCKNPNARDFAYYGGRGIEFRFPNFDAFFAELGAKPSSGHTVDRIDSNGHYEPGNVRWATMVEQNNNKRRQRVSRARLSPV